MNKKIRVILIIFIILNLIMLGVLISLILLTNKQNEKIQNENNNSITAQQIDEYHGKIYPSNFGQLEYFYKGNVDMEYFYEMVYKIVNYLPDLNGIVSNYSTQKLKNYYIQNEKQIKENTGITSYNKFEALCDKIKVLNKNSEYRESKIDSTSYTENKDYAQFLLTINYQDENTINLMVQVTNKYKKDNPSVVFDSVEE